MWTVGGPSKHKERRARRKKTGLFSSHRKSKWNRGIDLLQWDFSLCCHYKPSVFPPLIVCWQLYCQHSHQDISTFPNISSSQTWFCTFIFYISVIRTQIHMWAVWLLEEKQICTWSEMCFVFFLVLIQNKIWTKPAWTTMLLQLSVTFSYSWNGMVFFLRIVDFFCLLNGCKYFAELCKTTAQQDNITIPHSGMERCKNRLKIPSKPCMWNVYSLNTMTPDG